MIVINVISELVEKVCVLWIVSKGRLVLCCCRWWWLNLWLLNIENCGDWNTCKCSIQITRVYGKMYSVHCGKYDAI